MDVHCISLGDITVIFRKVRVSILKKKVNKWNRKPLAGAQCPDTFFEAGGGCFHVIDTGDTDITWEDARETCIGLSDSGWTVDLASLDSTAQLEAFAEAWATVGKELLWRPLDVLVIQNAVRNFRFMGRARHKLNILSTRDASKSTF